ncbi:MAG: AarF/ABC1/UbiB kinase family protein, partial [Myxococcales bacterium]|nr:AarF/ABC1/UbiB kinase family protein [Myxococcales bacterium]
MTRAAVGSPDTGKRLVAAFSKLGPTFVKLGQILSTRPDLLPPGILGELTQLQDQVSPLPFDQVVQQLRLALGPGFREHFETLDEAPLASASIAQVHRATLKDGTAVVLKVQRPGLLRGRRRPRPRLRLQLLPRARVTPRQEHHHHRRRRQDHRPQASPPP